MLTGPRLIAAITAFVLVIAAAPAGASDQGSAGGASYRPGAVIVKFDPESRPQARAQAIGAAGAEGSDGLGLPRTRVVELGGGAVTEAVGELEARPEVAWAEPDYVTSAAAVPDDPDFADGSQWGLRNTGQTVEQVVSYPPAVTEERDGLTGIDADVVDGWSVTTGSRETRIGVIDSGVARHEDLDANLLEDLSRDFSSPQSAVEPDGSAGPFADSAGHGTHVAGTVGAVGDNGTGVTGMNWQTGLISIRAMNGRTGSASGLAEAIAYAGQLGLPVANVSITLSQDSRAVADAVRLAPETLIVAAAGNNGLDVDGGPTYPCAFEHENVVCVAAIGNRAALAPFSNYGSESVDIGAPGNQILSTVPELVEVHPFPIDGQVIEDEDWTTGPPSHEWDVGEDEELLVSSEPEAGMDSHVTSEAFSLADEIGCSWRGRYKLDVTLSGSDAPGGILVFERQVGDFSWDQLGIQAANTGGLASFELNLQADGADQVRVRARLLTDSGADPEGSGAALADMNVECQDQGSPGTYELESGTSMAAPMVTGAAGLLLSRNPELTTAELRDALLSSARPTDTPGTTESLAGNTVTGGRLDVTAALEAAEPPPPGPGPQLRAAFAPGQQHLRGYRGLLFRVTSNRPAGITARASVSWPGAVVRRGDRVLRLDPGEMRVRRVLGGLPARWNPRARMAQPGHLSTLLLRPRGPRLRRLVRIQSLVDRPLRVSMAVRAFAPDTNPWPVMFRSFRLTERRRFAPRGG